jgi:hypothetical protein
VTEPITEEYLIAYAREQQGRAGRLDADRCPRCPHSFHGMACAYTTCLCPTSLREET